MKKAIVWIFVAILAIAIGFAIEKFLYNMGNKNKDYIAKESVANENLLKNLVITSEEEIQTSSEREKIGINTQIIEKIYYNNCDHVIVETVKNINKFVNLNKEELAALYPEWEITEFSSEKVVLYKEENDFCNEHFLVKEEDGYVTIYILNSKDELLDILEKTDIATKYLTETDKQNLANGIKVYTKQNLNKLIEDFE